MRRVGTWRFQFIATVLAVASAGLLTGCPKQGIVCAAGQSACGNTCIDTQSDASQCGACGHSCDVKQVCASGACQCQPGTQLCGSTCTDVQSDATHCGTCGIACADGDVCEGGTCLVACSKPGFTRCGHSCVNLQTDPAHCGACATSCADVQTCHSGACAYDVVAACYNQGVLVGVQAGADLVGPRVASSPNPQALAVTRDGLLVGDGQDPFISQAHRDLSLFPNTARAASGKDLRHLLVEEPYVYAVEDGSHTLQVLKRSQGTDGVPTYTTVGQLGLGDNSFPQAIAQVGTRLYIPLFGGFGASASSGQSLVIVDVSDKAHPSHVKTVPIEVDLQPFGGQPSLPRPSWVAAQQGRIYVTLNNLRPDYSVGGPGLLARYDPGSDHLDTVSLGGNCLNPTFVTAFGTGLLVVCGGSTDYNTGVTTQTGVVLLDGRDVRVSFANLECPAAQPDCRSASATHLAVSGTRVYVGDASQGRLFVFEVVGGQLVERRGFQGGSGAKPLALCPPGPTDFGSFISDVISVP